MIDPDKIEYEYAVLRIPKESIYLEVHASLLDEGEVTTILMKLDPSGIREAMDDYNRTVDGELPLYQITEKGLSYLEELEKEK